MTARHVIFTQEPGVDGDGITSIEKMQLTNDVNAAYMESMLLAYNTYDPAHPDYGAVRGSVDPAQRIINSNAINMAADDARDNKGILILKGVFECSSGVTINSHVDGRSGELHFFDTNINPAVTVGYTVTSTMLHNMHILLPRIRQMGKVGTGWSGNDIGLVVGNTYSCHITITGVHNFSIGARFTSNNTGNVYNNVYLGIFENNKIGLEITTVNAGGWTNEIVWIGGRFHINAGEGTNISGSRHIVIRDSLYSNNNHLFLKPSIEGNGPQYHVELGGNNNTIMQGRWEASGGPKLLWGTNANSNVVWEGWGAHQIQVSGVGTNCRITSRQTDRWYAGSGGSGLIQLANTGSTNDPVLTVLPASGDPWSLNPLTAWMVSIGARYTRWKNTADTDPRVEIDALTGLLMVDGYIRVGPERARLMSGASAPEGNATAPPGSLYMRSNGTVYRKGSGTGSTGWVEMS